VSVVRLLHNLSLEWTGPGLSTCRAGRPPGAGGWRT